MKKIVLLSAALIIASSANAGLYRWVDDAGNVHFSDKVPAAASKKSHAKLNKSGDVTKKIDPSSKQKELDSIEEAKRKREQEAEIAKIKREAQAVIQKRDDDLLSTYENEDELTRYFENKIKLVEGNSKILKAQNNVLEKRIVKLEKKIKVTKSKPMLESMNKKMANITKTIAQYNQALSENDEQLEQLSSNYKNDLERYKALTK